jgi:hypothetical protein
MNQLSVLSRRTAAGAASVFVAASLVACVAVPVDSRTGQVVPWPPVAPPTRDITVITPPAPSAPAAPSVYTARLYPVNDIASRAGLVTAIVTDGQSGRGQFSLSYLGDPMQGEASRVDAGHPGFGRIHREVLGTGAAQIQGRRGIANAVGARGINAQCEYVLTGPAQGTGACLFSDGARFQLHFG